MLASYVAIPCPCAPQKFTHDKTKRQRRGRARILILENG